MDIHKGFVGLLFLAAFGFPQGIFAESPLLDLVGVDAPQGSEETSPQGVTKQSFTVENTPQDIEEVVIFAPKPRQQNRARSQRPGRAMTHSPGVGIKDIKDETATTGENAKKKLPASMKPKTPHEGQLPYPSVVNHSQPILQFTAIDKLK